MGGVDFTQDAREFSKFAEAVERGEAFVAVTLRKHGFDGKVRDCVPEFHVFPTRQMRDEWVERGCKSVRKSRVGVGGAGELKGFLYERTRICPIYHQPMP